MPTDRILDPPDDWTQTFWGTAGIQFASLLPYLPVEGEGPKRIVPWIILLRGAINGFELGCALSLHDPTLGKSILERNSTSIDPFWGKTPADWKSVYEPVIDDLHKRISACGKDGLSYRNMFPESGPDLTQPDASKIIARQVFRGLILPLISEEAAEKVLISGTEEDEPLASSWYFDESSMKSMPIPELLTLVKQHAASVYREWAEVVGNDYMSEGSYHEAVEHYERALEIEPDNPDVLYAHAVGLMSISSYAQALDELDRVMELTNIDRLRDELFYSWRSIALFNLRRYEEAVSDCEAYVLKNPDDPDGQSLLDNMKRVRDYNNSSDSDRGSKSQYVRPPQLLFGRWGVSDSALASFATWDRIWGEDRLPFLNQQLELEPDDRMFEEWALLVNRGDELLWAGSNEEALNDFSRALELRPDNAYIWAFRGMALEYLDRLDEALIEYNRAIDLQPDMREKLGMNPDLSVEESSG